MHLPQIGPGPLIPLALTLFLVGVMVGTHVPWWVEAILLVLIVLFNSSWAVQEQEIGAISYMMVSGAFIFGLVVGDVSWWVQVGAPLPSFHNPFKIR